MGKRLASTPHQAFLGDKSPSKSVLSHKGRGINLLLGSRYVRQVSFL